MAKDPAVLWYWSDWNSGTLLMSRFLKGCYMDLLHAQFHNGPLSIDEIKTCLGQDFEASWPALKKKFKQDENSLFFNERLEYEKNRRKKFSDSRRNNVNKRYETTYVDTSVEHMNNHMETVTETVNTNIIKDKGVQGEKDLTPLEIGNTIEFIDRIKQIKLSHDDVKNFWQAFLLNGQEPAYYTREKKIQHFRNWIKTQKNGHANNSGSNGAHISARDRQAAAGEKLLSKLRDITGRSTANT